MCYDPREFDEPGKIYDTDCEWLRERKSQIEMIGNTILSNDTLPIEERAKYNNNEYHE